MGGSFDVNLTTSTTHLVAATTDTEKYKVATGMQVRTKNEERSTTHRWRGTVAFFVELANYCPFSFGVADWLAIAGSLGADLVSFCVCTRVSLLFCLGRYLLQSRPLNPGWLVIVRQCQSHRDIQSGSPGRGLPAGGGRRGCRPRVLELRLGQTVQALVGL